MKDGSGVFGGIKVPGYADHYGGNQQWFDAAGERWIRQSGCGTIAAANITAYLAHSDPARYEALYAHSALDFNAFHAHQRDVFRFVKPLRIPLGKRSIGLGIWSIWRFIRGVKRFAKSRGLLLKSHLLTNRRLGGRTKAEAAAWISEALRCGKPVAMLVQHNRRLNAKHSGYSESFERHWVTITRIRALAEPGEFSLTVSSWNRPYHLSFSTIWEHSHGARFAYFE